MFETLAGKQEKARGKRPNSVSSIDDKNKHLFFDEAIITVCGGTGGDGEGWTKEVKAKVVKNFKFSRGGNMKKFIELPAAEPADGGAGGNVFIRVDRACDSLLLFHDKKQWKAKKGYHGSAAPGAGAGRVDRTRIAPKQDDVYIDVPPGTVVRRKRSGELLGDMTKHGQVLLIAQGGAGGLAARRAQNAEKRGRNVKTAKLSDDIEVSDIMLDEATIVATNGEPGDEFQVELLMRVVADIGLVGLPNAGKSSILKAVTRASPDIAAYPFTTLMPNLGVVKPSDPAPDPDDPMDFSAYDTDRKTAGPVLADLPGLISGAHKGRGLGRAFLRHLRRTRAMLVVVDASGQDPIGDYKTVREELRMYNPEYTSRPHLLALNKMDLEWASLRTAELVEAISKLDPVDVGDPPVAVLPVSAVAGTGMDALLVELGKLMEDEDDARVEGIGKLPPRQKLTTGEGTTMKIRF
jgi:GTPase involved in cell partitioning and DNA repair|tara:strand:+ start:725 stop:2116 length:1392 start_codon:yes stop_codon:yes gene_type:complete